MAIFTNFSSGYCRHLKMASNAAKLTASKLVRRGFASQAVSPVEKPATTSGPEVTCTVMPNKLMVSSLDVNGPLARVSVVFRAGPRNETNKNLGATHVIRSMMGMANERCSGFAVIRNIQQNGGHFTCTGDREFTAFNVIGARDKINCALAYMSAAVSVPLYKHWQIKDTYFRLHYDIGCLTPQNRLIELFHKAAFRTGLGNSLFVRKDLIGIHTTPMLTNFYKDGFTANRAAVVGYNISHKDLIEFAKSLTLTNNDIPDGNSTYFGGELREETNSYFAHVAMGTQGVGMRDIKESLAYSVLQYVYGVRPKVVWGGSPSQIYKAVYPVAPQVGVSCFNFCYSDTGLFGIVLSGPAEGFGKAVEAAYKVLKSGTVSEAEVQRAKTMLKMDILYCSENSENIIDDMGIQSLFGGVIIPAPVLAQAIDKITLSDISTAAKKIAQGKLTITSLGNLSEIPYLDELK